MILLEDRNIVYTSQQKHKLIKMEAGVNIFHLLLAISFGKEVCMFSECRLKNCEMMKKD